MSRIKTHVKKGDVVVAIAGSDKSKSGKVLQIFPEKQRALVEGLNFIKKHMKPTQDNPEGGIIEREASIHVSNLKVTKPAKAPKTKGAKKKEGAE
ncbi:MAG: large subunit ribosomal protein L24 [Verrucomicrobiales bacterium]|jgi:large subunit ribosomal protein L24